MQISLKIVDKENILYKGDVNITQDNKGAVLFNKDILIFINDIEKLEDVTAVEIDKENRYHKADVVYMKDFSYWKKYFNYQEVV